jgi:hypothetical protein
MQRRRTHVRRWIALPLICVVVAGAAAATARTDARRLLVATTPSTAPLATGIGDSIFQGTQGPTAYAMARHAGATYARVMVSWQSIAPKTRPASGFDPTDPTSPYYHWDALDASVAAAHANHITPILDIVSPPGWTYSVKPGVDTGGSPNVADLHAFATAIAKHYDGSGPAPAEHVFSVWNEPNFKQNLYPVSPGYYRSMLNAVASSVHAVDPANLVAAGELAPVKHAPTAGHKNDVIPPLTFMQEMLCLSKTAPVHRTCSAKAQFDIWAHHPYSDKGPFGKASIAGGVELGDLPKMRGLLQTAERLGAISAAKPPQFWVTEVGWSSNAPNKHGVPLGLETRWLAETMYQMWRSGVTVGTWFLLQDMPATTPFQSGLYFRSTSLADARAKPLLTPFRFPFVAYLKSQGKVQIWGRDTTGDARTVRIRERAGAKTWKTVATITANKHGIFEATLPLGATSSYWLQATAPGSGDSAAFALRVPQNENLNVTPFPRN